MDKYGEMDLYEDGDGTKFIYRKVSTKAQLSEHILNVQY